MGLENGWGRPSPGKGREGLNRIISLVIASAWVFCACGCDRQARHKVLTFFFTGVPPLEEEKKEVAAKKEEAAKPLAMKKRKGGQPILKAKPFSHTPRAVGACSLCHPTSSRGSGIARSRPEKFGMLTLSPDTVCTRCHVHKPDSRGFKETPPFHSPVKEGHCAICHSPHRSTNKYMLLKRPGELCLRCHPKGELKTCKVYKGRDECISCHNPHIGKTMLLLNQDRR